MTVLLNSVIFLAMAAYMEFVAYFAHKYVMHRFLWVLHKDHHQPKGRGLQKNDLFALFFASTSFLLIYAGLSRRWTPLASAGFGVALYGLGYFGFHDVMFHRRVPGIRIRPRGGYLDRIVRAHGAHHRNRERDNGISFSFLYAPRQVPRRTASRR
jgi:beta-carotene 3-hydroxylase